MVIGQRGPHFIGIQQAEIERLQTKLDAMTTISAMKIAAYELAAVELKKQRNETIEECARVALDRAWSEESQEIASAIRALKR